MTGFLRKVSRFLSGAYGGRNADSNVYYDLEKRRREMVLAREILEVFVKDNSAFDLSMTPAQRFVKDQTIAFAKRIIQEFGNEHLTASLFRDGIENLYFLGHYWKNTDESVAMSVGTDLCRLIDGLGPLIELAEQAARIASTDWYGVCESIRAELIVPCSDQQHEFCTPSISYFNLDKLLGAGGFGAVYKARLGEAVCTVKFVPKSKLPDIEYAIVEKQLATMINHPRLVHYHATFATKEAYVTVMEYIRGVDVIRLVHLSTRLSEKLVRLIMAQLGLALHHLHYKGFVHRDVKPANLMITVGCRVKLIDFDTAKVCMGKYTKRVLQTFFRRTTDEFKDGDIAGTIYYMAPEMLKNLEYGRSIDWYSFGMTGYVLAVGKLPFSLKSSMSFEKQKAILCTRSHTWPKGFEPSKQFKTLIEKCLYKQASVRFCSQQYADFFQHPFFRELDLRWVETSPEVLKFDPVNSVAVGTLTYDVIPECESPDATPTAASKSQDLFPTFPPTDADNQVRLFTFLSPGFEKACRMIEKEETPSEEVIRIVPELVDFFESESAFFFTPKTE